MNCRGLFPVPLSLAISRSCRIYEISFFLKLEFFSMSLLTFYPTSALHQHLKFPYCEIHQEIQGTGPGSTNILEKNEFMPHSPIMIVNELM